MSATLAASRRRRMGALAGVGRTRRRRKSRRGVSDIGAMFGRRRKHSRRRKGGVGRLTKAARSRAAKKGWRRRKARKAGALAGLSGRKRRKSRRRKSRRLHGMTKAARARAARKGWRKRKARKAGALSGLHGRKRRKSRKGRRSRSRRRRGVGYMKVAYTSEKPWGIHGSRKRRKGRKSRRRKGVGATHRRRRKSRKGRKSRRLGYMKPVYSEGPFGISGRRRLRGMGYMTTQYSEGPFGIGEAPEQQFMGRIVPGQAIERYQMGRLRRRGVRDVSLRPIKYDLGEAPEMQFMGRSRRRGGYSVVRGRRLPWFARGSRVHGFHSNPKETFGVGPFKYIFSTKGVVGLGGLGLGRTVSNVVSHLLHFFLTSKDDAGNVKKLIPTPVINHLGDLIGSVGGYELGRFVGGKTYGENVAHMATLGALGGQLFAYLAMGSSKILDLIGLSVPGGAKYGGLGRYGAETEERAIGRYGAETEERAIGRYGAETEERAIGRYGAETEERAIGAPGQGSRPGGSRALPAEEQEEKGIIDDEGVEEVQAANLLRDDEPEEEFMGDMSEEPEEEFMGSAGDPF